MNYFINQAYSVPEGSRGIHLIGAERVETAFLTALTELGYAGDVYVQRVQPPLVGFTDDVVKSWWRGVVRYAPVRAIWVDHNNNASAFFAGIYATGMADDRTVLGGPGAPSAHDLELFLMLRDLRVHDDVRTFAAAAVNRMRHRCV